MLPTAEEYMKTFTKGKTGAVSMNVMDFARGFAKLHVTEALKQAADKATVTYSGEYDAEIDSDSILNAYPLKNIK